MKKSSNLDESASQTKIKNAENVSDSSVDTEERKQNAQEQNPPKTPEENIKQSSETSSANCVAEKEQEIERLKHQVLLAHADLENFRKRTQRDIEKAHKFALEGFIKSLLPVLDAFDMALKTESKEEANGILAIHKIFLKIIEKENIEVIFPKNKTFNPEEHEAIAHLDQEGFKVNSVIEVMQKGYKLNGRLIRPAMVTIAK